ncbi:lipopolysaccharide assembly protein LapB [Vibrio brasiliensis]|jgi:lipopolysaccharide biosynthesis regulator YciM|uniref:Lipopolysaccharide assembly protein B n=1 Tax=Vibrio brasiliensis LMG 20546 TaxID=945543 RepID=E8LZJ3_9VIBR|nr:lipopolysaccharide assembly protein LapB [Vibrio brasiliensis]EGA63878.1 tetratricopeptide repeat protein [Vibrio brasiliensis LMG 20546]MCG9647143.1 lipopolysaccharide assembly protein LapB [Vibrio brasiliensis]MCG9725803.1 lipopolysaccharide assembly protein LapB [Vibrio brasiliensis]MCG9749342.1 lipopolysaccharide assembly protein LapB [Vibrio brasiliensis]MCG9785083.1 lipopolysaccharide assembly protein LapB [Vibrio brasiliensis]
MLEILFLLLPIAAAYGWYMGNRSAQQDKQKQSNQISRQYVTGLNLLLSDQSDKAVDHFIELLQVDNETIDTHLALGNLFRSRGEVDRAIRIHQNLISRSGLTIDQKNIALQQLAKDYMASGFLDRAEKIFEQLVDEPDHREAALQQLVAIYQQTREWSKAINYASLLVKMGRKRMRTSIGHFWCELAMQEKAEGNHAQAMQNFKRALAEDPKCVRASIALGKLYLDNEDYRSTIKYMEMVLDQDSDFVSEVLPTLAECYHHLGQEDELLNFLRQCIVNKAGVSAELMLAQLVAQHDGVGAAQELLTRQLVKNPTMKGFYRLMDYHLAEAEEGRAKASLGTLQKLVGEQLKVKPHYRCRKCGFSTHSMYWHCPSCKGWGTIKPIRGLDGE